MALVGILICLAGCGKRDRPGNSERSQLASQDITTSVASEDSILNEFPNTTLILPNGDTLTPLGGHLLHMGAAEDYSIEEYVKNGTHYLRIHRLLGLKPNGRPILRLLARLRLPPMDSTEVWTEGMCNQNGNSDPSILGIVSTVGDSEQARRAWRFDMANETLREIPRDGVTCGYPEGDSD